MVFVVVVLAYKGLFLLRIAYDDDGDYTHVFGYSLFVSSASFLSSWPSSSWGTCLECKSTLDITFIGCSLKLVVDVCYLSRIILLVFMQHTLHTADTLAYVLYIQQSGARALSRNQGRPCGWSVAGIAVLCLVSAKYSEILTFWTHRWLGNR